MDAMVNDIELQLDCRPGKEGTQLVFDYMLHNRGRQDLYVMDAYPSKDRACGSMRASPDMACVMLGPHGDAIIGKIIPPLPTGLRMAVPIVPLASKLSAGHSLQRCLRITEPLAETSPYLPDLTLRRYEMVDIAGVLLTIGYWAADIAGMVAAPCSYAPGLYHVAGGVAASVAQRFPAHGLKIFRRDDDFPRMSNAGQAFLETGPGRHSRQGPP